MEGTNATGTRMGKHTRMRTNVPRWDSMWCGGGVLHCVLKEPRTVKRGSKTD